MEKLYEVTCKICGTKRKTKNYRKQVCDKKECNIVYEWQRKEKSKNKVYNRTCPICEKEFVVVGSKENCCSKNCHEKFYKEKNERAKKTSMRKYNTDSPNKSKIVKEKKRQTYQKLYGVDNPSHLKEVQQKISDAYNNKTDEEKESIEDKRCNTNLEKYGFKYSIQNKDVKEKAINTMIERYDCEIAMQNETLFDKMTFSGLTLKPYILPSGKEIKIQGYEYKYLNEYFCNGGLEDDIITHPSQKDIGKIFYISNDDNKKHRYYPDFYIKSTNTIIEVKSVWTYDKDLNKNLLKEKSCLDMSYNFEFKIYK